MAAGNDASLISALTPTYKLGVHWPYLKSSSIYQGTHTLRLRQPSRDPVYSRGYVAGDPVNLIDWKAFARNDQLIVRQQRHEASGRILMALDIGETMFWPDASVQVATNQTLPSKFQIALRLVSNLAYAHLRAGDQVTLLLLNDDVPSSYQMVAGIRSCQDIVRLFTQAEASGFGRNTWHAGLALLPYTPSSCDVLLVVSDALRPNYLTLLEQVQTRVRWLLHVLSTLETDSRWIKGSTSYFEDIDNSREFQGVELVTDAVLQAEVNDWMMRLEQEAKTYHFQRVLFHEQTPLDVYENWLEQAASP